MGLGMLLFWGVLIVLVILAVRSLRGSGAQDRPDETPLEILERRFARGEIDREEFEARKRDLGA